MTTIVTRAGKGSPLTHTEVDTNFTNLNTAKFETAAIPLGTLAAPSISFVGDANTGIYSPGADTVAFVTAGGNRVHITSAGLVGIGTSAPQASARLHVYATGDYTDESAPFTVGDSTTGGMRLFFGINNTSNYGYIGSVESNTAYRSLVLQPGGGSVGIGTTDPVCKLQVGAGNLGADTSIAKINTGDANVIALSLSNWTGSATSYGPKIGFDNSGRGSFELGCGNGVNDFYLGNGTTRYWTVDSSGRLLVGTIASPAHQLQVSTDSAGKPSTNTWTIVSDERIKEDIELADLDLCYQAVKNIPLKRFKWKDEVYTEEQVRDRRKLGWIAQDVEAVFPKAVGTYEFKYNQVFKEIIIPAVEEELDDDGNITTPAQPERIEKGELISEDVIEDCRDLNSDQLYAAMYGAIQKLMAKVEALEAKVAALKA